MSRVLAFSCTHIPFEKRDCLRFLFRVAEKYKITDVVCLGDLTDNHSLSSWGDTVDGLSADEEYSRSINKLRKWYEVFPKMKLCIGNHETRLERKTKKHNISSNFIKSYSKIWNTPDSWEWEFSHEIDGVLYLHGHLNRAVPAFTLAEAYRQSVVCGHSHAIAAIKYSVSFKDRIWGMNVGSLVDDKSYAMEYGRCYRRRSVISCGVVLDRGKLPIIIPMKLK
jgi:metallophosphoesterase superfamily enzyme